MTKLLDADLITVDSILEYLEKVAAEKIPLPPERWLEAAARLNALQGNEDDKLFELEQVNAAMRIKLMEEGCTATTARMHVEATDAYKMARRQRAKCERIKQTIMIAKQRARLAGDEKRNG